VAIDYYSDNTVFTEVLPEDYLSIASDYNSDFKNIKIKVLNPVDIICSKISRSNEADIEDIKSCIKIYNLKRSAVAKRAGLYARAGSDKVFLGNLRFIMENLF
jgi:acetyltransferase-like isoleucine patch superfamily enzyme